MKRIRRLNFGSSYAELETKGKQTKGPTLFDMRPTQVYRHQGKFSSPNLQRWNKITYKIKSEK